MGHQCQKGPSGTDHYVCTNPETPLTMFIRMAKGFGSGPSVELAYNICCPKKKKKRLFEEKDELPTGSLGALVLQSPITSVNNVLLPLLYVLSSVYHTFCTNRTCKLRREHNHNLTHQGKRNKTTLINSQCFCHDAVSSETTASILD